MPSQKSSVDTSGEAKARAPRLERGRARVAALKAAAEEVFAEKGYDAATMTEIAVRAGASIGSLYQFFPTKQALADALQGDLLEVLSQLRAGLGPKLAGRGAAEIGDELLIQLADFIRSHPALVTLAERRDIAKEKKKASRALLQRQVLELLALAEPPLAPERAETVAVVILQLMRAVISIFDDRDPAAGEAILDELRQMLRSHLKSVGSVPA